MKNLIKAESYYAVWYFTKQTQLAKYLGVQDTVVSMALNKNKEVKGYSLEFVDGEGVLPAYINPYDKGITDASFKKEMSERYKNLIRSAFDNINSKVNDSNEYDPEKRIMYDENQDCSAKEIKGLITKLNDLYHLVKNKDICFGGGDHELTFTKEETYELEEFLNYVHFCLWE